MRAERTSGCLHWSFPGGVDPSPRGTAGSDNVPPRLADHILTATPTCCSPGFRDRAPVSAAYRQHRFCRGSSTRNPSRGGWTGQPDAQRARHVDSSNADLRRQTAQQIARMRADPLRSLIEPVCGYEKSPLPATFTSRRKTLDRQDFRRSGTGWASLRNQPRRSKGKQMPTVSSSSP